MQSDLGPRDLDLDQVSKVNTMGIDSRRIQRLRRMVSQGFNIDVNTFKCFVIQRKRHGTILNTCHPIKVK